MQRTCIKFCFQSGIIAKKNIGIVSYRIKYRHQQFDDDTLPKILVFEWCKISKEVKERIEDESFFRLQINECLVCKYETTLCKESALSFVFAAELLLQTIEIFW